MKILLASVRYPPAPGGAETHVAALAEGFARRGHEVEVHTSDLHTEYPFVHREQPAQMAGVAIHRHEAKRLAGAWTIMPTLPRALREAEYDVLHAHSYGYYHTVVSARAAARAGRSFVFTPHFHPPWSMEGGAGRRALRAAFDPTLGRYVVSRAARVIGVSSGEMAVMQRHVAVDAAKVRIIPNGFHAAQFRPRPDGAAARARLGVPADAPLVVFAGRLASNKGLQHLVPAFARVAKELRAARLVVAGEDQGWGARVRQMAAELRVGDKVTLAGHQAAEGYAQTLAAADAFVLPSEWEAFGIVLAEAMACGVPCVATRVGGAPDVVQDGVTGRLVGYGDEAALADALLALLRDRDAARRMGAAGQARAFAEFSWDAVVERTLALYGELTQKE